MPMRSSKNRYLWSFEMINSGNIETLDFGDGKMPSLHEFQALISEYTNDESQQKFREAHSWTMKSIATIVRDSSHSQKWELVKAMCDQTGHNYHSIVTAHFRRRYYENMFSHYVINPRTAHELWKRSSLFSGIDSLKRISKDDDQRLRKRYPSYANACAIEEGFFDTAFRLALEGINRVVFALLREFLKAMDDEDRIDFKNWIESPPNERLKALTTNCPICGCYFITERKRGFSKITHCGSAECGRLTEINKPSKLNRRRVPQGWVKAYSARPCAQCGEKRVLSETLLCKPCFSKISVQ
jgi:hypothetical protein